MKWRSILLYLVAWAASAFAQPISPGCNPGLSFKSQTPNLLLRTQPYRRCPNPFVDDYNDALTKIDAIASLGACAPAGSCNVTGGWTFSNVTLQNPTIVGGATTGTPTVTGAETITADVASHVPLAVVGATAQSVDIQDWKPTGVSAPSVWIDSTGVLNIGALGATLADGANLRLGTSTGTIIGATASQKLGFFGVTPIIQPINTTDLRTALINLGLLAGGGATPLNLNGGTITVGNIVTTGTATFPAGVAVTTGLSVDNLTITGGGSIALATGVNVILSSAAGNQIGTATTQKLAFYGATPLAQPNGSSDVVADLQNLGLIAVGTHSLIIPGASTIGAGTLQAAGAVLTPLVTITRDNTASTAPGTVLERGSNTACGASTSCDLTTTTLGGSVAANHIFHVRTGGVISETTGIAYQITFGGQIMCQTGVMTWVGASKAYVADVYLTVRASGAPATVACSGTFVVTSTGGGAGALVGSFGLDAVTSTATLTGTPILKTNVVTLASDSITEETGVIDELN